MLPFERPQSFRGLSRVQLERIFLHHQWLTSDGRFGQQFVFVWKTTAHGRSFKNQNLDAIDLSRSVIGGISFSRTTLRSARFLGAELRNILFYECDIEAADFTGAMLKNVSFEKCNYEKAYFNDVDMAQAYWNSRPPRPIASRSADSPKM
jgi:uncharacterized protein YjbI with pentapeptide repeats